jgi:hypothetical protein
MIYYDFLDLFFTLICPVKSILLKMFVETALKMKLQINAYTKKEVPVRYNWFYKLNT